jgi:hypothetical protein
MPRFIKAAAVMGGFLPSTLFRGSGGSATRGRACVPTHAMLAFLIGAEPPPPVRRGPPSPLPWGLGHPGAAGRTPFALKLPAGQALELKSPGPWNPWAGIHRGALPAPMGRRGPPFALALGIGHFLAQRAGRHASPHGHHGR